MVNVSASATSIGRAVLRRQAVRQARSRPLAHATALNARQLPSISHFTSTARTYATAAIKAASGPAPNAEAISPLVDIPHAVIKLEGDDPISRYESSVKNGVLRDDAHQRSIIARLQRLHDELKGYQPVEVPDSHAANGGWMSSLNPFGSRTPKHVPQPPGVPKGMYLYGDVGTGKTMLMDLFYDTLPPHLHPHRRRVHFHAFMVDVFRRVHAIKHGLPRETRGGKARRHKEFNPLEGKSDERAVGVERLTGGGLFEGLWGKGGRGRAMDEEDAIYEAARELAEEGRILCFDEFQVTDIVTAMILRQLLERMMAYGVVCVITSNRHPDELYQNGIQRTSFLPCIDMIKDRFDIVDLDSGTDYRKIPRALSKTYFSPLNQETRTEMQKLFDGLTSTAAAKHDPVIADRPLKIWGRTLKVPESTKHVARFSFESLCGRPLSSADYLEITKNFGTIFVEEVGRMGLGEKDMARRFITFIDACYESKTRIFISSEVPIFQIFSDEDTVSTKSAKETNDHMRQVMDDLGLAADDVKTSSIFSGEEEIFAFARCVSRLVQMGYVGLSPRRQCSLTRLVPQDERLDQFVRNEQIAAPCIDIRNVGKRTRNDHMTGISNLRTLLFHNTQREIIRFLRKLCGDSTDPSSEFQHSHRQNDPV